MGDRSTSIIVEFSVPAEEFALYETLCEVPGMTVEVERVVAHEADCIVPCFWTSGENYETFERVAEDDPSIRDLTKLDEVKGAILYRAEWVEDVETVAYTMTRTGATLLDATGEDGQWMLQLRFDTSEGTTAFQRYLEEHELEVELHRLYELTQPRLDGQPGLTDIQHETLVTALERGYYETPRDVSMSELADELGISQQALSKRLRGGHHTLVENSLTVDSPGSEEQGP
ncbi:bacterio-opsin activator domain-containing protein [Halalkalicoccus ordinarius]|uniref:bacterio-opsin activator domain-containing protein n=1 Tax=Halalkalicoccus ordinarius TaxID=3116651 RepID=UPI00300ECCAE